MSGVKLTKGQQIKITKPGDGLDKIMCGYKWEEKSGPTWDIDGSVICLDRCGNVVSTVCYHNLNFGRYVHHHGDNLTGAGKYNSDKEQIDISLRAMKPEVERIVVIMNIYSAYSKRQDLTGISNCSMHIQNVKNGQDLAEFDISGVDNAAYKDKTGFYIGTFYRDEGEWKFEAIGEAIRVKNISEMEDIACDYYSGRKAETFAEYIRNHINNVGLNKYIPRTQNMSADVQPEQRRRTIGDFFKSIFS